MARLFTEGAEIGSLLNWTSTSGVTLNTGTKRSGAYSLDNNNVKDGLTKIIPASTEIYARCCFYCMYNVAANIFSWKHDNTLLGSILWNTTNNTLDIYIGSTLVKQGAKILSLNTWYLVEVHVKIADSGGIIEVKIDGLLDSSYNGDTQPGADATINKFTHGAGISGNGRVIYDDIAVNDISGTKDNLWCGDGRVIALKPNANGDSSKFVGSDSDSVDNYALVDEIPSDNDTTYVESATPGDYDLYNLEACGIDPDVYEIKRIWVEGMGKDTTTGSGIVAALIKTSGSEIESDQVELATSYTLIESEEWTTNPITSSAWTPAEIDALQAGIKVIQ